MIVIIGLKEYDNLTCLKYFITNFVNWRTQLEYKFGLIAGIFVLKKISFYIL